MFWFLVLNVHWVTAEIPGICYVQTMVTQQRFVIDRNTLAWKNESFQVPEEQQQCCAGYRTAPRSRSTSPLTCVPVCDPPCVKAVCEEPDTCVCYRGHRLVNSSNSTCYDVCEACVNSRCVGDVEECACDEGYVRDLTFPHICNARCSPPCVNGVCKSPDRCECFEGFVEHPSGSGCVPNCTEACVFGKCTAPDTCTCLDGYIADQANPNVCVPACSRPCEHGSCGGPDVCVCRDGYRLHPRYPFRCVPSTPEHNFSNICYFTLKKAILFGEQNKCFLMKEEVEIADDEGCRPLQIPSRQDCNSGFRCSTVKSMNGTLEINCISENDDFQTEPVRNIEVDGSEWVDVVLVITFQEPTNSSGNELQPREMTLRPSSERTVCGTMPFGVAICERDTSRLNVYNKTWISIILIAIFLVLAGAGTGGFLWLRYRRLHDPLNYREETMRGCYQNQSFMDQVGELVPDDESMADFSFI